MASTWAGFVIERLASDNVRLWRRLRVLKEGCWREFLTKLVRLWCQMRADDVVGTQTAEISRRPHPFVRPFGSIFGLLLMR